MLNNVTLLGRLAQDPEIRTTQNGTKVASFDLAVPTYNKEAEPDYIPIVCWKATATFADRYLSKGRQIVVEGRIKTRKYKDKDGNNRKAVEVVAESLYFADSNKDGGQDNAEYSQTPSADFEAVDINDDDLPF